MQNVLEGNWNQLKGKIKEKWGKLNEDDLTIIEGKKDQLIGKLQEQYGYEKTKAEKEVEDFIKTNSTSKT